MTEKHSPLSTQTALPTQSSPSLNPLSPAPRPSAFSYTPVSSSAASNSIHSNISNAPAASAASAPPPSNATAASSVPSAPDAPAPEAEPAGDEEPYTIKCICGFTGDDGNTIYCEICDSWQHIECFYPNNSEEATREEFAHACHECKPRALNVAHAVDYQKQRLQAATVEAVVPPKPKRPPSKSQSQSHKKKAKPSDLQLNGHASSASDVSRHSFPYAQDSTAAAGAAAAAAGANPPAKKSKSAHKSSHSVGGSHPKRSPSYSASRVNATNSVTSFQPGHPLSPATTPPDVPDGVEVYNDSSDLLTLCSDQDAVQTVQTNSFASLAVSNATSVWLREPERMLRETGHKYADVFQALPANIDSLKRLPRVETRKRVLGQDTVVRWRYLASSVAVDKDVPLMELNGQVGFQKDYCAIPANRYEELSCPLPFVFFHPLLPLYIDTRREGSLARYVRCSCRPNAVLDTFLVGGSEYQFWLVSDRYIAPDEQITIPWDFRLPHDAKERMFRILGLGGDDDTDRHDNIDVEEDEYHSISRWVSLVLSRYGGCACDLGSECAFARFHRIYGSKAQQGRSAGQNSGSGTMASSHKKKSSSRKAKPHALSPTSTGHATNSRAASEGQPDDFADDKMSSSSRSKPPSRDMTPAPRQGSFDTLGILTEPTDRDKRKVAMVEDSFRRLEQQPRKKKRTSDGTSTSTGTSISAEKEKTSTSAKSKAKSSPATTHAGGGRSSASGGEQPDAAVRRYVDAGTSRSKSGSPISATSPRTGSSHGFLPFSAAAGSSAYATSRQSSTGPSPGYRDATVQTDATEGEWYSAKVHSMPRPKRRVVSLSRRLLNCRFRAVDDTKVKTAEPMDAELPAAGGTKRSGPASAAAKQPSQPTVVTGEDISMPDAPPAAAVIPACPKDAGDARDTASKPPQLTAPVTVPPPLPAPQANASTKDTAAIKNEAGPEAGSVAVANGVAANSIKKSPDLRVQLPKLPSFGDASAGLQPPTGSTATPLSASSIVQSPFAITNANPFGTAGATGSPLATPVAVPSPVKKKMSLSDYTKSRKAAAGRPSVGGTPRSSLSNATTEEPKTATSTDGAPAGDSPTGADKTPESTAAATTAAPPSTAVPS